MADWYIATTGNDTTGDGSSGNPYLTLAKAHTVAASGDTVYVAAGTYTLATLAFAKNITIVGAGATTTIFSAVAAVVWNTTNWNVTVSGITFLNTSTTNFKSENCTTSHAITMTSCIIKSLTATTTNSLFSNYNNSNRCTITLNYCLLIPTTATSTNLFYARSYATYVFTGCVVYCNDTDLVNLFNVVGGTFVVATIKNTIICNASGGVLNWKTGDAITGQTVTYSCLYSLTGAPTGTGVITSDPLFVDAANENFNLRPSSPCIDTGTLV